MASFSEENYLKIIYSLSAQSADRTVNTNSIAEQHKAKAASVSDMLKKLAEKGLLEYQKYKPVKLTENGQRLALSVIRKHRLWETFLVNILKYKWDEVHELAEQLEHIKSDELINRIDKFLAYPKFDPHGDPIPDAKGNFSGEKRTKVSELAVNQGGVLDAVSDHSTDFLKHLEKIGVAIGAKLQVQDRVPFDGSMELLINNKKVHLSNMFCEHLWIK